MATFSSVRIHSLARAVAYPDSTEGLVSLIEALNENGIPFFVVGRMTNVLIKERIYNGVLINTRKIKSKYKAEEQIRVLCGDFLPEIARHQAAHGLGGFEVLLGIPGTVGGMVRQNAGAFGYEISDRLINATCYRISDRSLCTLTREQMSFSYRSSILVNGDLILLYATLRFVPMDRADVFALMREYAEKRRVSQPTEMPSLGSTFKRYDGVGAGYYIDRAGLKGYAIGGARVSPKHAGFIVNAGGATADDYLALVDYIKSRVYAVFGIELEEEIQII